MKKAATNRNTIGSPALTLYKTDTIPRVATACYQHSNHDADESQLHSLPQHNARHVVGGLRQRHANAHFVRALLDRVRHHSINSERA